MFKFLALKHVFVTFANAVALMRIQQNDYEHLGSFFFFSKPSRRNRALSMVVRTTDVYQRQIHTHDKKCLTTIVKEISFKTAIHRM